MRWWGLTVVGTADDVHNLYTYFRQSWHIRLSEMRKVDDVFQMDMISFQPFSFYTQGGYVDGPLNACIVAQGCPLPWVQARDALEALGQ